MQRDRAPRTTNHSPDDWKAAEAQWKALPNFVGDAPVLAMADTSGSMTCPFGTNHTVNCRDVAVSLAMYVAEKNYGPFKDCFLTFSNRPQLLRLEGTIREKLRQFRPIVENTNLHAAFDILLNTATANNVPDAEMPKILLILSDMQFDNCTQFDDTAVEMMERKYAAAGYTMPKIVFWNLRDYGNRPARKDKRGVSLVSGASPAILKKVCSGEPDATPEETMLETIMVERYTI